MTDSTTPREPTSHPVWRGVKIILGLALLLVGVVGLFLPVLQGFLFLFLALVMLSREIPLLGRYEAMLRDRYPAPWRHAERMRRRATAWYRCRVRDKLCSGEGES